MKTETKTAEELLREYVKFDDVNGSETIELLPLTIVDMMEEYGNQRFIEGKKEGISESVDECAEKAEIMYVEQIIDNNIDGLGNCLTANMPFIDKESILSVKSESLSKL